MLLIDRAGWHLASRLVVPPNITLVALPPKCPELNPVENVWQFMRDNWLSNRIFTSYTRSPRPLLRSLEQAHQSAMDHHVHRPPRLGIPVLISGTRYKSNRVSQEFGNGAQRRFREAAGTGAPVPWRRGDHRLMSRTFAPRLSVFSIGVPGESSVFSSECMPSVPAGGPIDGGGGASGTTQ